MTIFKSHQQLFMSMMVDDGYSIEAAAADVKIDPKTARRWLKRPEQTGLYRSLRFRTPIPGKMLIEDQEHLYPIIANKRTI